MENRRTERRLAADRRIAFRMGIHLGDVLRGLHHIHSATPEDADPAVRHLEAALQLDPSCAAAHAALTLGREMRFLRPAQRAGLRQAGLPE